MNRGTSALLVATGIGIVYATIKGTIPFVLLAILYPQFLTVKKS